MLGLREGRCRCLRLVGGRLKTTQGEEVWPFRRLLLLLLQVVIRVRLGYPATTRPSIFLRHQSSSASTAPSGVANQLFWWPIRSRKWSQHATLTWRRPTLYQASILRWRPCSSIKEELSHSLIVTVREVGLSCQTYGAGAFITECMVAGSGGGSSWS